MGERNGHTRMTDVIRIALTSPILDETTAVLRAYGRQSCEGFLLWVGDFLGAEAHVRHVLVPPQESIRSEDGVGYFVNSDTLFAVNKYLSKTRQRLIAQVHSHPTDAYHSETDDRYAIVTTDGGFSLVVPYFADQPVTPSGCAVYRLHGARWRRLEAKEIPKTFIVV